MGKLDRRSPFDEMMDKVLNWGRKFALYAFTMGTACCGLEAFAAASAEYDFIRFGVLPRNTPRHCDMMLVAGTITKKMAPRVVRLYEQIPEPKYVIAVGSCALSGGPFKGMYSVVDGVDKIIPVDVYVPGCPPRPEAIIHGIIKLQEKVMNETIASEQFRINLKDRKRLLSIYGEPTNEEVRG